MKGKKPHTSKRFLQFKKWLEKEYGIAFSEKQTLYSFRHSYITDRLFENESLALLAKVCGTSIQMLNDFYNSIRTEIESHRLVNKANKEIEIFEYSEDIEKAEEDEYVKEHLIEMEKMLREEYKSTKNL